MASSSSLLIFERVYLHYNVIAIVILENSFQIILLFIAILLEQFINQAKFVIVTLVYLYTVIETWKHLCIKSEVNQISYYSCI